MGVCSPLELMTTFPSDGPQNRAVLLLWTNCPQNVLCTPSQVSSGQASPIRLGTTSPLGWTPRTGQDLLQQSKPPG